MVSGFARYAQMGRINAHHRGIHALAISDTGKLLASGGADGLKVWDLGTLSEIQGPPQNPNFTGWPSCVQWLPSQIYPDGALVFGTGNGMFTLWIRTGSQGKFEEVWSERLKTGTEVMSIAVDSSEGLLQLAIGMRGCTLVSLHSDPHISHRLNPGYSAPLENTVPRCVAFTNTVARDIYILGMYNGKMIIMRNDGTDVVHEKKVAPIIGHAAVSASGSYFAIDNTDNGFNLHKMDTGAHVRTFETPPAKVARPKQVAFGEEGAVVVGGSDHGVVYVFETATGRTLQVLEHAPGGMVQTIATRDVDGTTFVACASSDDKRGVSISVWRRSPAERSLVSEASASNSRSSALRKAVEISKLGALLVLTLVGLTHVQIDKAVPTICALLQVLLKSMAHVAEGLQQGTGHGEMHEAVEGVVLSNETSLNAWNR